MANKEVHVGDDWYLGENNDGDLIFYNAKKDEVVKAIDVITGAEDKKSKKLENIGQLGVPGFISGNKEEGYSLNNLLSGELGNKKQQLLNLLGRSIRRGYSDPYNLSDMGAKLSICYDDAGSPIYDTAFPEHQSQDVPGTFFVETDGVGTEHTWAELREMDSASTGKIEIENHTKTHADLSTLSADEIKSEIEASLADFAQEGIKTTTLAYPFGNYDDIAIRVLQSYFDGARIADTAHQRIPVKRPFEISAYHGSNRTQTEIKNDIDTALSNGSWLVVYFHGIGPSQNKTVADLTEIIDYAQTNNCPIVSFSEGLQQTAPLAWRSDWKGSVSLGRGEMGTERYKIAYPTDPYWDVPGGGSRDIIAHSISGIGSFHFDFSLHGGTSTDNSYKQWAIGGYISGGSLYGTYTLTSHSTGSLASGWSVSIGYNSTTEDLTITVSCTTSNTGGRAFIKGGPVEWFEFQ